MFQASGPGRDLRVALEDGGWHHERSYAPERAGRETTIALWRKISTVEDAAWTRRYHSHDPKEKAFGGRVIVKLKGGSVISDEIALADAHPLGARPFKRPDYIRKFRNLAEGVIAAAEQDRFIATVERLVSLKAGELTDLTFTVDPKFLGSTSTHGIFDSRAKRRSYQLWATMHRRLLAGLLAGAGAAAESRRRGG